MLIQLNDGESVTVMSKGDKKNSITIICHGDWVGNRSFFENQEIVKVSEAKNV